MVVRRRCSLYYSLWLKGIESELRKLWTNIGIAQIWAISDRTKVLGNFINYLAESGETLSTEVIGDELPFQNG